MKFLLRTAGVLLILLGLLTAFVGLMFASSQQVMECAAAEWTAFVLLVLGALPYIPAVVERRWRVSGVLSVLYLAALAIVLGVMVTTGVTSDGDWTLPLALTALLVPGGWGLRICVGPREPRPEGHAAHTSDDTTGESRQDAELLERLQLALVPSRQIKIGAGLLAWSGLLAGLTGLQLADASFRIAWMRHVPRTMFAVCLLSWVLALGVYKLRPRQGVAAMLLALLSCASSSYWLMVSVRGGIVSLFALLLPFASLAASVLIAMQLPALARAHEARERLADEGIDLGL